MCLQHDEFAGEYAESIGPRSAAGMSHFSRASTRGDSRLDRDLKDALDMVKVQLPCPYACWIQTSAKRTARRKALSGWELC